MLLWWLTKMRNYLVLLLIHICGKTSAYKWILLITIEEDFALYEASKNVVAKYTFIDLVMEAGRYDRLMMDRCECILLHSYTKFSLCGYTYMFAVRLALDKWTVLVPLQWNVARGCSIIIITISWMRWTGLSEKDELRVSQIAPMKRTRNGMKYAR